MSKAKFVVFMGATYTCMILAVVSLVTFVWHLFLPVGWGFLPGFDVERLAMVCLIILAFSITGLIGLNRSVKQNREN